MNSPSSDTNTSGAPRRSLLELAEQVLDLAVEIQDWWNDAFVKKEKADAR